MALVAPVDRAIAGVQLLGRFPRLCPNQRPVRVLVLIRDVHQHWRVVDATVVRLARSVNAHWPCVIRVHDPLRHAHHVRTTVTDLPATEVKHPPEAAVRPRPVVRHGSRRPDPGVVVQPGRRLLVRRPSPARVLVVPALDLADSPELPVVDVVLGVVGRFLRPPLRAYLHDPAVALGRSDHGPALLDGLRCRLLNVDVLAGLAGHDRHQGVPVVRGRNEYCVQVLEFKESAEVLE